MTPAGPRVTLRAVTSADAERLWRWRDEPGARAASFNPAPIALADHERWLAARLAARTGAIYVVIAEDGREVGYVRFDEGRDEALVSVALAPEARGRGYGAGALAAAVERFRASSPLPVVALIRADNPRSVAAFRRAGFAPAGTRRVGDVDALAMTWSPPPARVLLAADSGHGIGLGHAQRTLALAAALAREGACAGVVCAPSGTLRDRLPANVAPVVVDGWPRWDDDDTLAAVARAHGAAVVVVDSYRARPGALAAARATGAVLVLFDDLAAQPLAADVVVNGGAAAAALPYATAAPGARLLLGPQYAPLGPPFWEPPARKVAERPQAVLVTAGGADAAGTPRIVGALGALAADVCLDVVVGPFADPAAVERAAAGAPGAVRVHRDPPGLRDLLVAADLAVSAAGHTLYELAWAGCPTVAFVAADNQAPNLSALAAAGVVRATAAPSARDFETALAQAVSALLGDRAARAAMSAAGRRLVDGRGALRVAREVLAHAASRHGVHDRQGGGG